MITSKVKDWISPTRRTTKGIEKHHLFPKDYLRTVLEPKATKRNNQSANFALVEWSDDIAISNKPPCAYGPVEQRRKTVQRSTQIGTTRWPTSTASRCRVTTHAMADRSVGRVG